MKKTIVTCDHCGQDTAGPEFSPLSVIASQRYGDGIPSRQVSHDFCNLVCLTDYYASATESIRTRLARAARHAAEQ